MNQGLNEFNSSFAQLTQTIERINNCINEFITNSSQQQKSRFRFDIEHRRFSNFFFEFLNIINIDGKKKKFRKFEIGYFDFKCLEIYNQSDYVTIENKVHYRNV